MSRPVTGSSVQGAPRVDPGFGMPRGEVAGTRQRQRQRERGLKVFGHNREGLGGKTAVGKLGRQKREVVLHVELTPERWARWMGGRNRSPRVRTKVDEAEYNTVPPQHVGRRSQSPFTGWPPVVRATKGALVPAREGRSTLRYGGRARVSELKTQ
ncbi:uncharacterized protein CIMG_13017 [Coccidioides immitis RS]|uniref:Uncharacterized protein n=1 Tax=Coccidioides immitis (strain RS) TaxID=246410 RepID=J3K7H3_COCIM|nr:uncharacterized protein CIMG_13017 [Coccidioides immitis RS]EAS30648.3 hypothetical protein CIMG_13017 [Coccidioides immitis RS]TPX23573.1 hypothetical protein DIZ76_012907 [Coccidioides immitis]